MTKIRFLFSYWSDFVLVWEEPWGSQQDSSGVSPTHITWREEFLDGLKRAGLLQEKVLQVKKRICFILLSAPWSVLCYFAEEIRLRVPLQVVTAPIVNWSDQVLSKLSLPNPLSQDVPNPPPDYYTCQFRTNKLERFLGSDNQETFFKTTQRHQVLYEILARTPYGSVKKGEVGIDRLVSEQVFTAAYPLHEVGPPSQTLNQRLRQILYGYWAKWSSWSRYQPLDHIREYFGEKIALYFAWLGFYTGWLLPASLVGTFIFLVGFWLVTSDVPAKEVCDSGSTFIMCPLCNICSYWNYSSICIAYKAGLLFDNGGTVFLSVFMSLWAVTFLEYWKRTCSALSHRWDCSDFEDIEERPRPEFTAMAPMTMRNPITGAEEPYFPEKKRFNRTVTGCMVIVIMVNVLITDLCRRGDPSRCFKYLAPVTEALALLTEKYPHLKEQKESREEAPRLEEVSPWEEDYQLLVCEGLLSEYLEMVIQFGFITIFVAACPLAPLFALINNWVEIRLDAQKFVTEYRRPVVERAQDIGIWFSILQFITHTAVLSNAFLIAFTSSFVPRLYYRYTRDITLSGFTNFTLATSPKSFSQQQQNTSCRYQGFRDESGEYLPEYFHLLAIRLSFVIVFEHVVFFVGRLIDLMVPDIPEEVEMKMKREHYMAKEALAENQVSSSVGKVTLKK
uniref:Anoctamin n=1 Tax=Nothobranchius furzeri TaxID=105023 RepID=A0A8C6KGJ9_NOTFU